MVEGQRRFLLLAAAVTIGMTVFGFLQGTELSDYDLTPPLTRWAIPADSDVPVAKSYAEERADALPGDVATGCKDCHEERISPRVSRGERTEHPTGVAAPQGANLTTLSSEGSRFDRDDQGRSVVVCRSCHRPHNTDVKPRLIEEADDGLLCLNCHADHAPGRSRHPVSGPIDDPALRAMIARLGGPDRHDADPGRLSCLDCHAPHAAKSGDLLRTDTNGNGACRSCHVDKARALVGAGHGGEECIDCHGAHAAPAHAGRGPVAPDRSDQYCVECHMDGSKVRQIDVAAGHPIWKAFPAAMQQSGHTGMVGCTDCHQPHGNGNKLLIAGTVVDTCLSCHPDKSSVTRTKHDGAVVAVNGEGRTCLTCHSIHGDRRPAALADVNPASAMCLSCHDGKRTNARQVGEWRHPGGVLLTAGGLPGQYSGTVPYFTKDGRRASNGQVGEITCQTCHDPHRWHHDADQHPGNVEGTEQNSFLRDPDKVAEFCTVCHGTDGRPQFRFFHSKDYRAERKRTEGR
jgi:predicted CXXCH cytochrome family protein